MVTVGTRGDYEWLVTDQQFDLVQICPEVVVGKFVAITSFDSGALVLTDEEKAAGWASREEIAYSPKIEDIRTLPRDCWDEWYIFGAPVDLGTSHLTENIFEVLQGPGHVSVLVNYAFALHRPEMKDLVKLFWEQIDRIRPESYVANNDCLNFVSLNRALFAKVHNAVKALG